MNEARLYELAHEALLTRWGRSYDDVRNYPNCDFFSKQSKRNYGMSYLILNVK